MLEVSLEISAGGLELCLIGADNLQDVLNIERKQAIKVKQSKYTYFQE